MMSKKRRVLLVGWDAADWKLAREARQQAIRFTAAAGTVHPEEISDRFRERDGTDSWTSSRVPYPLPPRAENVKVAGLPRTGTSMMMQMLAAGGGGVPSPTIIAPLMQATSAATSSTISPAGWPSIARGSHRPAGKL